MNKTALLSRNFRTRGGKPRAQTLHFGPATKDCRKDMTFTKTRHPEPETRDKVDPPRNHF